MDISGAKFTEIIQIFIELQNKYLENLGKYSKESGMLKYKKYKLWF